MKLNEVKWKIVSEGYVNAMWKVTLVLQNKRKKTGTETSDSYDDVNLFPRPQCFPLIALRPKNSNLGTPLGHDDQWWMIGLFDFETDWATPEARLSGLRHSSEKFTIT